MKRWFAAAALAPLSFAAAAHAQTTVSTATTTPLTTSTAGDVTVTSAGSIIVNTPVGVTVDSNNKLDNSGAIIVRDATTGTGVLVTVPAGGRATTLTINGNIGADDTSVATDTDSDGDIDGPYAAAGTLRNGVQLTGPGVFTGNITQTTGSIGVKGVGGSTGVLIESGLVGNLTLNGAIANLGDNSYGVRVTGPVTGDILLGGTVNSQGKDASALLVSGPITGQIKLSGAISSSGYRYTSRPATPALRAILDADDLLQGGPAVWVGNSVTKGVLLYAPPGDRDAADTDEDDDGIEDATQTSTGSITQYGTAPALLIGATGDIALGNVGTGALGSFGVALRGSVSTNGVNDGVSTTAVQIGGLGGAVTTGGGVLLRGAVSSTSYLANATGLRIGARASAPLIEVDATLQASSLGDATHTPSATALQIDAGASVPSLVNNGVIAGSVSGPTGAATAIVDNSGSLASIVNSGGISSSVASTDTTVTATGTRIAVDLRANTSGVNFVQKTGSLGVAPAIQGDVLFGSGAGSDSLDVQNGIISGNIAFGGGADTLRLTGGAIVVGDLTKGAGSLAVDVSAGLLSLTNTGPVNLSTLNVGSAGILFFTADPTATDPSLRNGQLNVAGTATLADGARIGLNFASKLSGPASFTVIRAASLVNNGADDSLLGDLPFIYDAELATTSTTATINVRQRTMEELGLSGGRAAAFDAFYSAIDSDPAVLNGLFTKTNETSFDAYYNQFLPDYSGGIFQSLALGARNVMRTQAEEAVDMTPGEPRSWLQEVGSGVKQESPSEVNYRTTGFGLAGGYEIPVGNGSGAAGISAAFLTSDVRDQDRSVNSVLDVSSILVGGYWRDSRGGLLFDASLNGGYVWVDSTRQVIDESSSGVRNVQRDVVADWSGFIGSARGGVAYDYKLGAFYVRPDLFLDYVFLRENGYTETGGGTAVDLQVDGRSSSQAGAEAGITVGARFGRTFRWGPELRVGYRTVFAGGLSDTTARFVSLPGQPFTLSSIAQDDGRVVVMAALRGSSSYANFAFEGGGEIGDLYKAYMARLVVRFLF